MPLPEVHLAEDLIGESHINPTYTYCYRDEDFIGRMKHLCKRMHRRRLVDRVMYRYLLGMSLKLADIRDS
eukprot:7083112-Alexandrium_andersonii.AAC.1